MGRKSSEGGNQRSTVRVRTDAFITNKTIALLGQSLLCLVYSHKYG